MDWFNKLFKSVKLLLISYLSFLYSLNKNKRSHLFLRIVNIAMLIIFFFSLNELFAEGDKYQKGRSLNKNNGTPSRTHFNINNISTWIYNNGDADISPTGNSGFEYPKGSGKTAVFESGLLWGGKVNGEVRVGGSHYNQGLLPGRIDENGLREDTSLEHVRIYRVRTDWKFGDLSAEIIDEEGTEVEIRAQYEKDWNEWPAIYGAPFNDIDENGTYDPLVDIPGVSDADQTIWYVANDIDPATTRVLYGSDPMGIEMQVTIWGYNINNSFRALDNTLFKKYKLINKSVDDFDSMYVAMWADPDLGGAGDDYVGCDPDLSLMFCYNGDSDDNDYGNTVPAVGFDLVQGPIVIGDSDDEAIYNGKIRKGYKNLPMTSHYFTICGGLPYTCPTLGDYEYGTLRMWKILRGLLPVTGEPFISPVTGQITKFTLDGDPVTRTGWLDGWLRPPGDRTQTMSSGPFTLATGDTQEIVFAEIIAGGVDNIDRLQAVQMLKHYDREVQNFTSNLLSIPPAIQQPNVVVSSLDQEIILSWGLDDEERKVIEEYDNHGYKFQGYAVYQYPNLGSSESNAIPITTYDLIDGMGKVIVQSFNVNEGIFTNHTKFRGTNSGIKRYLSINSDTLKETPLYNGSEYYFAVSSYAVSSNPLAIPKFIESPIQILTVIPQKPKLGIILPEETYGTGIEVTHSQGSANASASAKVVDPNALTGDDYEVFFQEQHYYLDIDGKWKKTNYADSVGKALGKLGDVSPSTIAGISVTSPIAGTRDLKFFVNIISPDNNYAEGVKLTFPQGVQINSADADGYYGIATMIDNITNSVIFGKEVKDATDLSGDGAFAGGELITVNINTTTLPLNVNYTVYDDGWATLYCADTVNAAICSQYGITDAVVINAEGICNISEEAFVFKTEQQWNVKNATQNTIVLDEQIVINGKNLFTGKNEGATAAPVVDGIQVSIDYGGYKPPVGMLSYALNDTIYSFVNYGKRLSMSDCGMSGWCISGRAVDNFGNGTTEIELLQKDYELRVTGEYEPLGTDNVYRVKEGTGSMATLYGARGYDIKDHPLNPNPGSSAPFLVRIPFEVWNVDDNQQVNLLVYDRIGSPADEPFYSFNPDGRMYCYPNNTAYSADVINSADYKNADTDNLTWNWIFWQSDLTTGDVVNINYANPIQMGKDVFSFTAPPIVYDGIQAKEDVKKINVYPNPYYGTDLSEFGRTEHYVTFNHLPNKAIIRIYNLAGHRIRKITKDDESQFLKWNLMNENNFQIANGMYIVYIDLPDLGETKIIKLAVITEQLYQSGY